MSVDKMAAWQHLTETGLAFDRNDRKTATALHNAALKYAALFPRNQGEQVRGTNGGVKRSGFTAPFGRSKGQPIEELGNSDLDWLTNAVRESVNDPAGAERMGRAPHRAGAAHRARGGHGAPRQPARAAVVARARRAVPVRDQPPAPLRLRADVASPARASGIRAPRQRRQAGGQRRVAVVPARLKSQWRLKNEALLDALEKEQATR